MSHSAEILALSPLLYWRLEEASGSTFADDSGNSRTGALSGSGITYSEVGALESDPSSTAIKLSNDGTRVISSYNPFTGQRSFIGWGYRLGTGDNDTLFGGTATSGVQLLRINSGAGQTISWFVNGGSVTFDNAWPGINQWVHYVLTFDNATKEAKLYINGAQNGAAKTTASSYPGSPGNYVIGGYGAGTDPWNGRLDEKAIIPSILTLEQVETIYNAAFIPPDDPFAGVWSVG